MKPKRKHGRKLTLMLRRQMCNRGQPCEGCTRRNQASLCRYAPNAIRNKARPPKVGNIQERLDNLEVMLASIAANPAAAGIGIGAAPGTQASSSQRRMPTSSYEQPQSPFKSARFRQDDHALPPELPHRHESGDGQVSYIDPSHWRAILDEIKEVREHLSAFDRPLVQEEPERKSVASEDGAGFMFGKFPVVDLEDIISTLPPRSACDALVAQYFNARFMVLGESTAVHFPLWPYNLRFGALMQAGHLHVVCRHPAPGQVPKGGQSCHQGLVNT